MLLFVENKRIFAGLSVSRWGWLLHNAALTLISSNERNCPMSTPKGPALEPPAAPLGKRLELAEMDADINFLVLGADALQGIGAMMQPEMDVHDEQLNQTRRSDMAAIFRFFGEALRERAGRANESVGRLWLLGSSDPG